LATVLSATGSLRQELAGYPTDLHGAALNQAVHDVIVTPLPIFWEIFGLFLFLIACWILLLFSRQRSSRQRRDRQLDREPASERFCIASVIALATCAAVITLCLLDLWLLAFLLLIAAVLIAALMRRRSSPRVLWICGLILLACGLAAFTEIAYIRDYLDGGLAFRMNTVAKLYNQIWLLLAVPAAGSLALMARSAKRSRLRPSARGERFVRRGFLVALGFTVCSSLFFTYAGTISRETYRQTWLPEGSVPFTLDGMAFMKVAYPGDYAGISWLNAHVRGTPIVLEADQAYYNWRSRVAQFTGLPDLFGGIYESAQRYPDEVAPRQAVLEEIYGATDADTTAQTLSQFHVAACPHLPFPSCVALRLLRAYDVGYVYVGLMEKQLWPSGVRKFSRIPSLTAVFHYRDVTIYHVNGGPT